jgi:UDP-glucose 4-epimerase
MRVAVAGASGLIGSRIAAALVAAGHAVLRVGRGEDCDLRFDLADDGSLPEGALGGCDALVHAAGVTDEDFAQPAAALAKALLGACKLADAARAAGTGRVVYVSSAHVYGPLEGRIDEGCPPNPLSDYAIAHYASEQVFRRWALRDGGAALLLRPCAVYGMPVSLRHFARWSLIPFDFPRQALGGRIVLKTAGTQRRNFVAAEALGTLVSGWLAGPAVGTQVNNAAGEAEMPVYDFALRCAGIVGELSGRGCRVERSGASTAAPPFHYHCRDGDRLGGIQLDDHVRRLAQALMNMEQSKA